MYKTKKRVEYVQERKTEIIGDPILITQYNKMEDTPPLIFGEDYIIVHGIIIDRSV